MAISAKSFAILTTGFRVEGFFFCGSFMIFLSIQLAFLQRVTYIPMKFC